MFGVNRRTFLLSSVAGAAFSAVPAESAEPLKVGFVFYGPIGDYGWTYAHNQARLNLEAELGDAVTTIYFENVDEGAEAEQAMLELVARGCGLIFATSFGFMSAAVKVAQQFPDVKFEHATGYQRLMNLATYNARFCQGRAVLGTIAGHMSKSGLVGYLASFAIPEVMQGINAFTLAAQKVNPDIVCRVTWANTWYDPERERDAAQEMIDQGIDVITTHTDSPAALQVADKSDVIGFGQGDDMSRFAPKAHMTSIIDNWAPYYIQRARQVLDGKWRAGDTWWGMAEGAVQIGPYSAALPDNTKSAAETVRSGIVSGTYDPFAGPIRDQSGRERVGPGDTIDDSTLLTMDWLVEGVES